MNVSLSIAEDELESGQLPELEPERYELHEASRVPIRPGSPRILEVAGRRHPGPSIC